MKVALEWLKNNTYLPAFPKELSAELLAKKLTMAGLELETLDSDVLELSITPNRGDCLSLRGLCREIAALCELEFTDFTLAGFELQPSKTGTTVEVQAPLACPLYAGCFIRAIDPTKKIPTQITHRLNAAGIDSIHPIVDICNYVMLDLGQPLHAFDAKKIADLIVRFAKKDETLILLNQQTVKLSEQTLIIADQNGPLAIAGVIGGLESSASENTTDIFLESAHFTPLAIAGQARRYGLNTDAAQRFERGVDPALPQIALMYAAQMITQYLGGKIESIPPTGHFDSTREKILLTPNKIERLLGMKFTDAQVEKILSSLGMAAISQQQNWQVTPPSWRFDITQEEDLIEELARLQGYDHIPLKPASSPRIASEDKNILNQRQLQQILLQRAYHEIISYSFISEAWLKFYPENTPHIRLQNPLSNELAVMRQSLWPSLLNTLQYNLNRQQERARLFEFGRIYLPWLDQNSKTYVQPKMLAGLITGSISPKQWSAATREVDFFDLKADVEALLAHFSSLENFCFKRDEQNFWLHPKQAATIFYQNKKIGTLGCLHPEIQKQLDLPSKVYLFEISIDELVNPVKPIFHEISKFPLVTRDFAFIVDRQLAIGDLLKVVRKNLGEKLNTLNLFDVYEGKGIAENQKSIAFNISLQKIEGTWQDEEVDAISQNLITSIEKEFAAKLR